MRTAPPRRTAQEVLQELGVLGGRVVLHQDIGGHFQRGGIELLDELGDDLAGLAILWTLHEEMVAPDQLAVTDEEHLHPGFVGRDGTAMASRSVWPAGIHLDGALLLELLDGGHLVAEGGGALEFQLLGRRLHLVAKLTR